MALNAALRIKAVFQGSGVLAKVARRPRKISDIADRNGGFSNFVIPDQTDPPPL